MQTSSRVFLSVVIIVFLAGCAGSHQFIAVPADVDRAHVPTQSIEMTAERFHYTPEEVHVKAGTLVKIDLKATKGTHGFDLPAYGIDVTVEEGETKTIEFYAQGKGEYDFHCSHFCGMGHPWMTGKIIVE